MKLNTIKPAEGSTKAARRVGEEMVRVLEKQLGEELKVKNLDQVDFIK